MSNITVVVLEIIILIEIWEYHLEQTTKYNEVQCDTQYSSARGSFPEHFLEVSATKHNEDSSGVALPP